jgi:hypothetical protein
MRIKTLKIAPNEAFELAVAGDYVRVRQSLVDLIIENQEAGEVIEVSQGDDFTFTPFKTLRISHSSSAEQVIKLIVSTGKKAGSSQVGGSVTIAGDIGLKNSAYTQGRASVTNANQAIIPANLLRKYLLIQNNDQAAFLRVKLDGSAATVDSGFRIPPNASLELATVCSTNAINCIMETATGTVSNVEFVEA